MTAKTSLPFDNSYLQLGPRFYTRQAPEPVSSPTLIRVNHELARYLGIDPGWLESGPGLAVIAGNATAEGSVPIATVYAGHQFGSWNPQLGDGRALLLGELVARDGVRYDIQLKGSGRTSYSRSGDGRAPLGPVLREYLVSEAMAVLGVPTSRALAAVSSGDAVWRESRLPGAVLTRVAQSHIRIGTLQYFAAQQDHAALEALTRYVIRRHYPQAAQAENPVLAMLEGVVARQAELVAQWQCLGFIHGVMNTDNMLLSGETIDYGPCAFMDRYDPATVFSSIDHFGRYAYRNQPHIANWNLAMLAQALLPLLSADPAAALASGQAAIDTFPDLFQAAYRDGMRRKLGLKKHTGGPDAELTAELLALMHEESLDFTLTFRRLSDLAGPAADRPGGVGDLFELPETCGPWLQRWRRRLAGEKQDPVARQAAMYRVNPAYIPRNHLVEEALDAAQQRQDFGPFERLLERLARPFEYEPADARLALPPRPEQVVKQTFCGT